MQLFCITYAGGSAKFFREYAQLLPKNIECIPIEYAGRGERVTEAIYESFDEMVEDVAEQINMKINEKLQIVIFGYSMGSLVTYEIVSRNLLKKQPITVFVAAHFAPSISSVEDRISSLSDEEIVNRLQSFGGFDERLINNKRFWTMFLPTIRNDYRMLEMYNFKSEKKKINIDVTVFYSESDTPYIFVKPWQEITTGITKFVKIEGTHFFLRAQGEKVAEIMYDKLFSIE